MAKSTYMYNPDYAVPPGWVLEEHLAARGFSQAEFARLCGRSPKLISEIISGKAPIEPRTALEFERVLGMDAGIWLGIDSDYQIFKQREAEAESARALRNWMQRFPVGELVARGYIEEPSAERERLAGLLKFFGVGSYEAWMTQAARVRVTFRHSPSFESDEAVLATWLRMGELKVQRQDCAPYNRGRFARSMLEMRALTTEPIAAALKRAQQLSNEAGVALAIVRSLPRAPVSGAARWLRPDQALIQLSARHRWDDHFWFSLFHEAAHILLHSKKLTFLDSSENGAEELECEANDWAANALIRRNDWRDFVAEKPHTVASVRRFAREQGVSPGIVVGRLQHEGLVRYDRLNHLKVRLQWTED